VLGKQLKHVVKKSNPRGNTRFPFAVNIEAQVN
jgi:hypothetical protein